MTLLIEPDPQQAETYAFAIGHDTRVVDAVAGAQRHLDDRPDEVLVVVGAECDLGQALELASALHVERPHVGLVLMRRRVDVTVLNQALRAGVREVVNPEDLSALGDACRRSLEVSRRMSGATTGTDAAPEGKVITVFAAKGGCGKTTVATNLAFASPRRAQRGLPPRPRPGVR